MHSILVIEDEAQVRANLVEILELGGYEARATSDGAAGVQLATDRPPDLIICDVMMPQLDGFGVLAALREQPQTATVPFVFLTARIERADVRRGMDLGADDYLTKPFTPDEVLAAVTSRLDKQTRTQQAAADQLDQLRRSISHALPHELRTPLNGIIGFASLLAEPGYSFKPDEVQDMAGKIKESGERLFRLIRNFLLYAELELATTDPQRQAALCGLAIACPTQETLASVARQQLDSYGRSSDLAIAGGDFEVAIDPNHFQKILSELLDNACKFSPSGSPIEMTSTAADGLFCLTIADRGRGLTAEQIAQVGAYQQFERKLYEQSGSGLGLAIAQRLAELYGGSLHLEPRQPGLAAILQLPLA